MAYLRRGVAYLSGGAVWLTKLGHCVSKWLARLDIAPRLVFGSNLGATATRKQQERGPPYNSALPLRTDYTDTNKKET